MGHNKTHKAKEKPHYICGLGQNAHGSDNFPSMKVTDQKLNIMLLKSRVPRITSVSFSVCSFSFKGTEVLASGMLILVTELHS